ncbi:hypothetical protein CHL_1184 [Campylobacter hyointestinalis subsp. lawsonii CCUG 27631]|uniref:hypothetical protein n=1 Tax=Campylobacter hyointestinalis TaxID=198 RepID=UPI0007C9509D|nr:hypothetical protein [Campylobacter hyointestinalis]ANE34522.1 hypothetical protein CHL_1184 [Campylobacter hyointestinalis subsp. lawsonii CCUG 27631]
MKIVDKCVDSIIVPSIVLPALAWERVKNVASKVLGASTEHFRLLWNSRILGFVSLKSSLNELRIQAKSRSDELIVRLREEKVAQLAKLVNSANFGAENKLYRWGLEKALIEAGQKCEQAMKVKLDNKTSKTLKDKSLWSEYITSLEANAIKTFESEFEVKTARAFELANKTHDSMKKIRGL